MFKDYVTSKKSNGDFRHMKLAIEAADSAKSQGEQARGAVLVFPNKVIAEGQSILMESDPTCHAEINVIRKAAMTHRRSLKEGTLYVTSEPCAMCAAAAINAGIQEIIFGAYDHVQGFVTAKKLNLEDVDLKYMGGVLAEECYTIASPSLRESLKVSLEDKIDE
jgi:tRNA(adenine34) deaminase